MKYLKHSLFLALAVSKMAFAGGWVVGGGEIMGDAVNPWFLNNNPNVKYCVMINETNFGQSRARVEAITARGLNFWMRQFKEQESGGGEFVLNKLNFTQEECKPTTDLKFQFGTIDLKQIVQLPDLDRKIAVSVRTDYDRVNLRGKGFIYISPELGPLALHGPQIQPNAWSLNGGSALQMVLIHELGHVFGLRHDVVSLMAEDYVEFLLNPEVFSYFAQSDYELDLDGLNVFKIAKSSSNRTLRACTGWSITETNVKSKRIKRNISSAGNKGMYTVLNDFFGIDFEYNCYGNSSGFENGKYYLDAVFGTRDGSKEETIRMEQLDSQAVSRESTHILKVFLPKEQKVFTERMESMYYGQIERSISFHSKAYDKLNNIYHPVIVTLHNDRSATVTTEFQGKIYVNILGSM